MKKRHKNLGKRFTALVVTASMMLFHSIPAFAAPDVIPGSGRPTKSVCHMSNGSSQISEFSYDSQGNMVQKVMYNTNQTTSTRYAFTYDSQGNLLNESHYNGATGELLSQQAYDGKGNLVLVQMGQGFPITYEYVYNDFGKPVSAVRHEGGGNAMQEYLYDAQGNLIREINYGYDGVSIQGCVDYLYNEQGQLIVKAMSTELQPLPFPGFEKSGTYWSYYDYAYDGQGRMIKEGNSSYEYDSQGRLIKLTDSSTGRWTEYLYE